MTRPVLQGGELWRGAQTRRRSRRVYNPARVGDYPRRAARHPGPVAPRNSVGFPERWERLRLRHRDDEAGSLPVRPRAALLHRGGLQSSRDAPLARAFPRVPPRGTGRGRAADLALAAALAAFHASPADGASLMTASGRFADANAAPYRSLPMRLFNLAGRVPPLAFSLDPERLVAKALQASGRR